MADIGPTRVEEFDLTGLICPLPVLKIRKQLMSMKAGEVLAVVASDPATQIDIPHFCAEAGHTLVDQSASEGLFRYSIQRG